MRREFAILVCVACAQDVPDIDRTQPGRLRKEALTGDWYYMQTVVDVPATTGFTFAGETSDVGQHSAFERVRFELAEEVLLAERAYEQVEDSERPSVPTGTVYRGAPIAAFGVVSHFDVKREYNEATGEQSNVLEENTQDRPWYERDYLRLNLSRNLVSNFEFLSGGRHTFSAPEESASYAITNPNDPDAPVFGVRAGNAWTDHRDPAEWGELKRIDYFDVTLMVTVEPATLSFEGEDGLVEELPACWFSSDGPYDCAAQTIKLRHSFLRVSDSDYVPMTYPDNMVIADSSGDGETRLPFYDQFGFFRVDRNRYVRGYAITEADRIYLIDRYNLWRRTKDDKGRVLPYSEREIRPVVFYLSSEFPDDLVAAALAEVGAYNVIFSDIVNTLQGTSGPREVVQLERNSGQRTGDARYNLIGWIDEPQLDGLLGYGPHGADPTTGEVISGTAYLYGAHLDEHATVMTDQILLMRNLISPEQYTLGPQSSLPHWTYGTDSEHPSNWPTPASLNLPQIKERRAALGPSMRQRTRSASQSAARLEVAERSSLAAKLAHPELERAATHGPTTAAARLRRHRAYKAQRERLGRRGVDLMPFHDGALSGLVQEFATATRDEIYATLRQRLLRSTLGHELGHVFGLTHNFAGSADALNYSPRYWQVRDPDAQPLLLPTAQEEAQGLRQYAYASIMDYAARYTGDMAGLGYYDRAALKFGYGELVEVFVDTPDGTEMLQAVPIKTALSRAVHYSQLPAFFSADGSRESGLDAMQTRIDVPLSDIMASLRRDAGAVDYTQRVVPYKFCDESYNERRFDCSWSDEGADAFEMVSYAAETFWGFYYTDAFKRYRRFVDPYDYYELSYGTTMGPISNQYKFWVVDSWDGQDLWDHMLTLEDAHEVYLVQSGDWLEDPNGGLTRTAAAQKSLQFLSEVVSMPEPGSYYLDPTYLDPTGPLPFLSWYRYDPEPICTVEQDVLVDACASAYVPVGAGRFAESLFDLESGFYGFERIAVIGSFWDKLAAIEVLSDPSIQILGVDDVADLTTYLVGYNLMFPEELYRLFGGLVADDYRTLAPRYAGGRMTYADVFNVSGDVTTPRLDPATNFTVGIYALYYGMALLNSGFDQSFNDSAKIWLQGSGEALQPEPQASVVSFANPINGRVYQAVRSREAAPAQYALGAELLTRANALSTQLTAGNCFAEPAGDNCGDWRWRLDLLLENIELVRGMYDLYGYATF